MKYYDLRKEAKKKRKYQYELAEVETFKVALPAAIIDSMCSVHKYVSLISGMLTTQKSYQWDGSTVPLKKWYRWIWNSDKYCKIASLFHDACYQLMKCGALPIYYKGYVDKHYRELCIEGGMGKKQAGLRFWVLDNFYRIKIKIQKEYQRKILEV